MAAALAALSTAAFVAGDISPAHAATPVGITTVASPGTTLGYQIRATVNLHGTTVTPTGTATFRLYGPADVLCSSPIVTSVVAMAGTSAVAPPFVPVVAGIYRWTTSYGGDMNYYPAGPTACDHAAADVLVSKARTTLRINSQAPAGGSIAASATLTGLAPTGPITVWLHGPGDTFCTGAPVFTTTVNASGAGSYQSARFAPSVSGTFRWKAYYSGDVNHLGSSTSGCNSPASSVVFTA